MSLEQRRVLITGGGPVGLLSALLLGRQGLPVRLFDVNESPQADPRAATTHPATLDLLAQDGLADDMKLAVPDMISNSYFPAIAAIELGFFRQEGLDIALELIFPVDKAYAALRDGAVDFVGGSAHSALAAFPQWEGVKLLCAQAQGMSACGPKQTFEGS